MNVVLRADAGSVIGTGHVMRCAALAQSLMKRGAQVHLLGHLGSPALASALRDQGLHVHELEPCEPEFDAQHTVAFLQSLTPVSLLIVDHYGLDIEWERAVRQFAGRLAVFDDLGRAHHCAVLIDQNLHRDGSHRYDGKVPGGCRVFVGPKYASLRPQFEMPDLLRPREAGVQRISVFFGGTDVGDQIGRVLEALRMIPRDDLDVSIVCGPANPMYTFWQGAARDMSGVRVLRQVTQMAAHLFETDLALGACGVAAWERCALGVPALVSVVADNQLEDAELLHERGAVRNLGRAEHVSAQDWADAIQALRHAPDQLSRMAHAALEVMDGWAAARETVVRTLLAPDT